MDKGGPNKSVISWGRKKKSSFQTETYIADPDKKTQMSTRTATLYTLLSRYTQEKVGRRVKLTRRLSGGS